MRERLFTVGLVVLVVGLTALGVNAFFAPEGAADGYGIAAGAPGWISATGLRDVSLAVAVLGVWRAHPIALRPLLLGVLVVPLGDVAVVLLAGSPLPAIAPHAIGAVGVAVLWWLAPRTTATT